MASKTPEGALKEACVKLLRLSGFYVRIIAVGAIPGRTNPSKGMADCVAIRNGRVLMIEFKSPKGKLSVEQKEFLLDWAHHGGECFVIRSIEEVQRAIRQSRPVVG